MANVKISDLTTLTVGDIVTADDVLPIVDKSAGATKKSTAQDIVNAGLKTPGAIGGTTPAAGTFTTVLSNSGAIGYTTGAGGTVSQGSWLADVTLNTKCGQIGIHDSAGDLTPFDPYYFIVHNNKVGSGDSVILTQVAGGVNRIFYSVGAVEAGAFQVIIHCVAAQSVASAILSFAIINNVIS